MRPRFRVHERASQRLVSWYDDDEDAEVIVGDRADPRRFSATVEIRRHDDRDGVRLRLLGAQSSQWNRIDDGREGVTEYQTAAEHGQTAVIYQQPSGRLEFGVDLPSKPEHNRWRFKLLDHERYSVCYQAPEVGELDTDDLGERGYRFERRPGDGLRGWQPEDVVGSYAIYSDKRNNRFRTGKIGHVYRPRIVGADGKAYWCEIEYLDDVGVFEVMAPRSVLNRVTYPAFLDPNLGYTSIGANSYNYGNFSGYQVVVGSFTAGEAGDLQDVFIYGSSPNNAENRGLVYQNDGPGGDPGTLIVQGDPQNFSNTNSWQQGVLSSGSLADGQTIWVGMHIGNPPVCIWFYDGGTAFTSFDDWNYSNYPAPEDPFNVPGSDRYVGTAYSVYVFFEPGGVSPPEIGELTDGLQTSDSMGGLGRLLGVFADTIGHTDTLAAVARLVASYADELGHADSLTARRRISASVTDGLGSSDGTGGLGRLLESSADTAELSDILEALGLTVGTLIDSMGTNDVLVGRASILAAITDQWNANDIFAALARINAERIEAGQFGDLLTGETADVASLFDQLQLSDTLQALRRILAQQQDTLTTSDVLIAVASLIASQSDALRMSDTLEGSTATAAGRLDSVGLSDAATALRRLTSAITDTLLPSDTRSAIVRVSASVVDTLLASDVTEFVPEFTRATMIMLSRVNTTIRLRSRAATDITLRSIN